MSCIIACHRFSGSYACSRRSWCLLSKKPCGSSKRTQARGTRTALQMFSLMNTTQGTGNILAVLQGDHQPCLVRESIVELLSKRKACLFSSASGLALQDKQRSEEHVLSGYRQEEAYHPLLSQPRLESVARWRYFITSAICIIAHVISLSLSSAVGALRIWTGPESFPNNLTETKGEILELAPVLNRLLIFWSDAIPHEVHPTSRDRYAATLWLAEGSQ